MEYMWSPWRYDYMALAGKVPSSCVFCVGDDTRCDRDRLIVHRGEQNFVILNLYPYTAGHFMVAPYTHVAELDDAPSEQTAEMMSLATRGMRALRKLYRPDGFNLGMNLGQAAGAGVRDHFHLHVVPRWLGDANFMSVVAETRVLPEELSVTYQRLAEAF